MKVSLTKKEFDSVKEYLEKYAKANLVMNVATQEFSADNPLYQIPFDELLVAIYRPEDIVIEQTVGEQLAQNYNESLNSEQSFGNGYRAAMVETLDIINMKVKGINA